MSQRDDKTIAFRPRARRDASPEAVDEPVYEVDDVAVGPDGSVSPRPSGGELASPSTRARSHRRARATSDAGDPTPLRPHPARTASSAASTGDLHRAIAKPFHAQEPYLFLPCIRPERPLPL